MAVADAQKESEDKLNYFGDELKIAFKKHETDEAELRKMNKLLSNAHEETAKLKQQLQAQHLSTNQ